MDQLSEFQLLPSATLHAIAIDKSSGIPISCASSTAAPTRTPSSSICIMRKDMHRRRTSLALPAASGTLAYSTGISSLGRNPAPDSRAGPRDGAAAGALPTPADLAGSDLADTPCFLRAGRGPGDAEPHVVVLVRGRVVVAVGRGQVVGVVVPRAAPQPARRTKSLCCPVPMAGIMARARPSASAMSAHGWRGRSTSAPRRAHPPPRRARP